MQTIHLNRFGTVLVSRPVGLKAFNAIRSTIDPASPIQIDFEGVLTVAPSWFDEFLTHLAQDMDGAVELLPTTNASVRAVLPVLSTARDDAVADIAKRALEGMERE